MPRFVRDVPVPALLLSLVACSTLETPDEQTVAERIWALEQAYWESNRAADYEEIIATWHDRFLGWPDAESAPVDKEQGAQYAREQFQGPDTYEFEILPRGLRVTGDVAVNHYTVLRTWKESGRVTRTQSMRITHTWLLDDGTWKVLGGMSNVEEPGDSGINHS